jgi:hypothetical protein
MEKFLQKQSRRVSLVVILKWIDCISI